MGCMREVVLEGQNTPLISGYKFCRRLGCPGALSKINNALNCKLLSLQYCLTGGTEMKSEPIFEN